MRPSRFLLLALPFLVALGCEPAEHAVLLEVYSTEDVADLRVIVQSLESPRRFQEPARRIDRTAAQIAAEPIRVVVSLAQTEYALVHLVATTPTGDELYATRCYPIGGVVEDEVMLFGPLGADRDPDGDGFVEDASTICRERGEDGNGTRFCDDDRYVCPNERASDCAEGMPDIHPGAPTICADGVDQDCDGMDEVCGDLDGDDVQACPAVPTPNCDCDDSLASINPFAMDTCLDGIDQDCDGEDDCCDADGDNVTRCAVDPDDCDDTNPAIPGPEACDGVDNDCNGLIDELDECRGPDLDGDGVAACGRPEAGDVCDCNDCDPSIHGGGQERCAPVGIDDDCDGMIDEGCPANDMDRDGVDASRDCNDGDPLVFPPTDGREPFDRCEDGVANNCIPGEDTSCEDDADGDGWVEPAQCDRTLPDGTADPAFNPAAMEGCDGADNDCDGLIDEGLSNGMISGCSASMALDFQQDVTHCGGCRITCDLVRADACVDGACVCPALGTGEQCAPGMTCCGDGCFDLMNDEANCGTCGVACGEGEMCVGGQCRCGDTTSSSGQACPDATTGTVEDNICCDLTACRNVRNDDANCGACGLSCGANSSCINASCQCTGTWQDCDGNPTNGCEVDVRGTNVNHCGACNAACQGSQATWSCVGGACQVAACTGTYADCDGVDGNGCEANTQADTNHCGGCGVQCTGGNATWTCDAGACTPHCLSGFRDCNGRPGDGCEVFVQGSDVNNCGGCGTTCSGGNANWSCNAGACVPSCLPGYADCNGDRSDGCEVRIGGSDITNCGGCGTTCGGGNANWTCNAGMCQVTACAPGYADCNGVVADGCEVLIAGSDEANCGACGSVCGAANATGTCDAGTCTLACIPGYSNCDTTNPDCETHTAEDEANCGACNAVCGAANATGTCTMGSCMLMCATGYSDCDLNPDCETHIAEDEANCGMCGATCGGPNATGTCTGGTCTLTCDSGYADCTGDDPGCETYVADDEANCGGCGVTCGTGETCNAGVCECGPDAGTEGGGPACGMGSVCCDPDGPTDLQCTMMGSRGC